MYVNYVIAEYFITIVTFFISLDHCKKIFCILATLNKHPWILKQTIIHFVLLVLMCKCDQMSYIKIYIVNECVPSQCKGIMFYCSSKICITISMYVIKMKLAIEFQPYDNVFSGILHQSIQYKWKTSYFNWTGLQIVCNIQKNLNKPLSTTKLYAKYILRQLCCHP